MIEIICTLLMISIVILGVVKKFHPVTVLFTVSLVSLIIWSLVTGQSAMGDEGVGNIFFDVFEYAYTIIKNQISSTMLVCASIFGYVGFMNKIGASNAFTTLLATPLSKIKQPYLLLGTLIVLEAFLKLVIPSASSIVALLLAILYPIFVKLGCSNATIASAFILGTCITWGPADAGVALTVTLTGTDIALSEFFLSYQLFPCVCEMIVMAIVFVLLSKYYDKKYSSSAGEVTEEQLKKQRESLSLQVPTYYAIMPLFPLILIILFSGKIFPITLSTVAVVLISLCLADIIHLLNHLDTFKETLNDMNATLAEFGSFFGRMGFMPIGGALFAGVIGKVGGMTLLVTALNNTGGGVVLLSILGVLIAIIVVSCTGSYTANLNIFVPFLVSVADVTGTNPIALAQLGNMACGLGSGLAPVSRTMLFVTGACNVDFPFIFKRNIIPVLSAAATGLIVSFVFYVF